MLYKNEHKPSDINNTIFFKYIFFCKLALGDL